MERSENRILTTHAGSLPRPRELVEMQVKRSRGEPLDPEAFASACLEATRNAVAKQLEAGIDVGNDGEQARESFFSYVQHRMTGFSGRSERPPMRDVVRYPSFLELKLPDFQRTMVDLLHAPKATGAVRYDGLADLESECVGFERALAEQDGKFVESFMTSASPGIVAAAMQNEHYSDLESYVGALAEALRVEWEHVVARGFVLQLDCPDLAIERHTLFADRPLGEFLGFVEMVIGAINDALVNVPRDRVRMHVCWGNYEAPHDLDVELREILPLILDARVGALLLSLANPRHAHEIRCFETTSLPDEMLLVAGVIDTTTNYVEHPELVADRIERVAGILGDPTRVIAGTDCGFDTAAGLGEVAEEVVWVKLRSLSEGARIASGRLLG